MDFCRQAAARTSDGLILSPPFAPLACWWARAMVESTIKYSKSRSSASASNMRSQTPFALHRLKRRNALFHPPNASGRSRQRRTGPHDPLNALDEHAVVAARRATLVRPTDDQAGDTIPLRIAQNEPFHDTQRFLLKESLESHSIRFENVDGSVRSRRRERTADACDAISLKPD